MKSVCPPREPLTLSKGTMPEVRCCGKWGGRQSFLPSYIHPLNLLHIQKATIKPETAEGVTQILIFKLTDLLEFDRFTVRSSSNKIAKRCQIIGLEARNYVPFAQWSIRYGYRQWLLEAFNFCFLLHLIYFTLCRHLLGDFFGVTNSKEGSYLMGKLPRTSCIDILFFIILYFRRI